MNALTDFPSDEKKRRLNELDYRNSHSVIFALRLYCYKLKIKQFRLNSKKKWHQVSFGGQQT